MNFPLLSNRILLLASSVGDKRLSRKQKIVADLNQEMNNFMTRVKKNMLWHFIAETFRILKWFIEKKALKIISNFHLWLIALIVWRDRFKSSFIASLDFLVTRMCWINPDSVRELYIYNLSQYPSFILLRWGEKKIFLTIKASWSGKPLKLNVMMWAAVVNGSWRWNWINLLKSLGNI